MTEDVTSPKTKQSNKLHSDGSFYSRKRRKLSSQALHYFLSFRPIYPKMRGEKVLEQGHKISEEHAQHDSNCWRSLTTSPIEGTWTTLPLPAVLGRRNLVESWWSSCPSLECQAHMRCQTSARTTTTTTTTTKSQDQSKRLSCCSLCEPLVDARRVLALSKAMLYVSQDGTINVTARHHQLVRFEEEKSSGDPTSGCLPIGTLSIGNRPVKQADSIDSLRRHQKTPWMQFRLQLQSKEEQSCGEKDKQGHGVWHKVNGSSRKPNTWACAPSVFPSTPKSQKRRRVLLSGNGDSSEEEDDCLFQVQGHGGREQRTLAARKLMFNDCRAVGSTESSATTRKNATSKTVKCYECTLKQPPPPRCDEDTIDRVEKLANLGVNDSKRKTKSQVKENSAVTRLTSVPGVIVIESLAKKRKIDDPAFRKFHEQTTSQNQKQAARLVTPEHDSCAGKTRKYTTGDLSESLHRRRRLMELDQMGGTEVYAEKRGSSATPCQAEKPTLETAERPPTNATAATGGILSMPDDSSKSENASSSFEPSMVIKEVATQLVTSPQKFSQNSEKVVKDMTLDDWKRFCAKSRPGSFQKALCCLVVAKNKCWSGDGNRALWLPPLLDRNDRMDYSLTKGSLKFT